MEPRSSLYVAPLQFNKSSDILLGNGRRVDDFPDDNNMLPQPADDGLDQSAEQPLDGVLDSAALSMERLVFHNYLRAFYPFQPTDSLSPSTVTLPLNAGDIVLVHSIHTNGWADGTLLENGSRGWLPTNYCEPYDHIPMRPLLKALTEFWDVIRNGSSSGLNLFRNQDYMRGLIAGVRYLLEKSDCLTRGSPLVKHYESVRRSRKALLSELSLLVKIAKRLQDIALRPTAGETVEETFDEMLLKAFKIVTRGVKFLDIWTEDVSVNRAMENVSSILGKPVHHMTNASLLPRSDSIQQTPGEINSRQATTNHDRQGSRINSSSPRFHNPNPNSSQGPSVPRSDGQKTPTAKSRPVSIQSKRISVSHRMSYNGQHRSAGGSNLASKKLDVCYDTFLGVLGSFLGLHMQSRSSSELLLTTQQSVKSCRELLAVIETVFNHDFRRSDMLLEAKDAMYDKIVDLGHAAREVFQPLNSTEEELIFLPEEGKRLVNAATACVRGAGECVAKTRIVLEEIGDFEIDAMASRSDTVTPNSTTSDSATDQGAQSFVTGDDHQDQEQTPQPMPTRPAPQLEIPTTTISPPSPLSSIFTPLSASSTTTIQTPISTASTVMFPDFNTGVDPLLTPPTPAASFQDHNAPEAIGTNAKVQLWREKSLLRNVINSTGSDTTYDSSVRESRLSATSDTSTRATTPDMTGQSPPTAHYSASFSESRTTLAEECDATEDKLLEKTFAHELMYSKEGQISGGSLPALIEKLTAHDSTPDALFVATFYLTFRLFTTPAEFVKALVHRFEYVGEFQNIAGPVRLRVYNVFKGWLESHWRHDCDDVVLPSIRDFGRTTMTVALPSAAKRLLELADKVATIHGPLVPRLVSSIGKTNTSIAQYVSSDAPMPAPMISKSQLAALKTWKQGGAAISILDFDPLELARQITLKESSIFCSILPEELLATEWMKRSGSLAVNVRAMSTLSTDLANLVADSILQLEEPKKRAVLIKHWVKIAKRCLELNNYDTLMAIICSLNSSTIARLKKTWEIVSQKTKNTLEDLKKVVDVSKNYAVLRSRLQNHVPPCLPFVGTYLTDLTFVDHGNQATRTLKTGDESISIINYDKHMKTARIISELQRFQIPYRLTEIPELQTWMQDQLVRVRSSGEKSFQNYYRRSLILEPREQAQQSAIMGPNPHVGSRTDKFDFLSWAHAGKDKFIATNG